VIRRLRMPMLFVLLFSLISSLVFPIERIEATSSQLAVVNVKSVVVRSGPGPTYPVIGNLKSGTKLQVYSNTKSGWSEIRYNKKKAYTSTQYLKFPNALTLTQNKYKGLNSLKYPQIKALENKTAENKINSVLSNHIKKAYTQYVEVKQLEKEEKAMSEKDPDYPFFGPFEYIVSYTINYNEKGLLSILITDYIYSGGAHGSAVTQSYNFNINTGQQIKLFDVLYSKSKQVKTHQYVFDYMLKHKDEFEFIGEINDFTLTNNTAFYYTKSGIVIQFQQYEVASYAAGRPSVFIPKYIYTE
jgi:uncharacterized protein YraI